MTSLSLAAPMVAFLLLAAHFFRADNQLGLWVSLLAIVLIFVRRPWAARALQVLLVLGSLEWLRSAVTLIHARGELGQPFLRLSLILGAVFLLTALSALVFQTSRLRAYFKLDPEAASNEGDLDHAQR
jgi:hypothetical protein